jgi:low temperature requirement protein LtrA
MKLRKDFIVLPTLRSSDDQSLEKHADWLELLFDLIFVAAISQIALNLSGNYSTITFLESLPLFFAIWWGWSGHTFYLDRFGTDDIFHRILTMIQMVVVASLAINVRNALTTTGSGFAISYAVLRFILVAEYIRVGRLIPGARPLTNRYSLGFGIAATIWLFSAFVPAPYRFVLWGLAILIDFLTPFTAGEIHIIFPPHPTHLPERFGLFTIIVIGEAIVSVVLAISNVGLNLFTGLIGLMALIISFSIWWGYFEEAGGAEARVQERGDQIAKYQLWLYSHFPLLLGIVGTAAGIKHVILLSSFGSDLSFSDTWMLCISLSIALISLSLIFISSFKWEDCKSRLLIIFRIPYYLIILLVFSTGFLGTFVSGFLILVILTLLCVIKDLFSLREVPEDICNL